MFSFVVFSYAFDFRVGIVFSLSIFDSALVRSRLLAVRVMTPWRAGFALSDSLHASLPMPALRSIVCVEVAIISVRKVVPVLL